MVTADESPGALREKAIRRALGRTVTVTAAKRPLEEIVDDVAGQAGLQVWFDRPTIPDEGVALAQTVTLLHENVPVRSALKLILEPVQLAWIIRNEVLTITTAATARWESERHVYDITDVSPPVRDRSGVVRYDSEQVVNAIRTTIQPETWDQWYAGITALSAGGINVLVIQQPQSTHEAIAQFLEEMRDQSR